MKKIIVLLSLTLTVTSFAKECFRFKVKPTIWRASPVSIESLNSLLKGNTSKFSDVKEQQVDMSGCMGQVEIEIGENSHWGTLAISNETVCLYKYTSAVAGADSLMVCPYN